ncbi:MAG: DNA replication/repair protein RecF [Clostridia bacterium]|nr:DNA replication/repair protein RecF [Clostridia bacterium]
MKLTSHSSFNFRNIEEAHIEPHPEMNIIYGENGQGKTNLIESVWMLTGFYSFRARKNIQLIKDSASEAVIESSFYSNGREQTAKLTIGQKKELILNGVKEDSPRAMMGSFYSVVFSPSTLGIVKDGPGERRKMLDIALSLMKPNYALAMSRYLRVIEQRNALLRKFGQESFNRDYIFDPWDEELVKIGSKIIRYRLDYIEQFSDLSADIYNGISSGREKFDFYYSFSKENISDDEIKEKLKAEIEKNREADARQMYTGKGPHTHDLIISINDKDARTYASQGQQRSAALAMKLGEASIIEKTTGECPIVLLDDVMSELDEGRQNFILNYLNNWQVFITCCDPANLMRSTKGKIFEVKEGKIQEI